MNSLNAKINGCLILLSACIGSHAQVTFKDAFPGLKFDRAVSITEMPGISVKTYAVLEQHAGMISIVQQKAGVWTKQTMYQRTVSTENEMGILGIAFHPDYKNNHRYFIYYNPTGALKDVIEEREADSSLIKDAGKVGKPLISLDDPATNHNGGSLGFGPDGFLYAAVGDGGGQDNQFGNGQNRHALFAKMMRLDVDHPANGKNYGIPTDNPFVSDPDTAVKREIWAWGFRNPWRWTFDPLNGDLWVADVGQGTTEEVDIVAKGANYGWPIMEGPNEYKGTKDASMIPPVFSYTRSGGNCVIGAAIYRGNPLSKFYGNMFVTDESTWFVTALKKNGTGLATATRVGTLPAKPTTMNHDFEGRIFVGIEDDAKPVYQLDSPDLTPSAVSVFEEGVKRNFARTRLAARGSALPAAYFTGNATVHLVDMNGASAATLTGRNPVLREDFKPGLYVVRISGSRTKPELLVVR
ncbi:MAG: yliI [Fibrobacteres bacterium]|nr:yliI [Fibrobacterota bacterium]